MAITSEQSHLYDKLIVFCLERTNVLAKKYSNSSVLVYEDKVTEVYRLEITTENLAGVEYGVEVRFTLQEDRQDVESYIVKGDERLRTKKQQMVGSILTLEPPVVLAFLLQAPLYSLYNDSYKKTPPELSKNGMPQILRKAVPTPNDTIVRNYSVSVRQAAELKNYIADLVDTTFTAHNQIQPHDLIVDLYELL